MVHTATEASGETGSSKPSTEESRGAALGSRASPSVVRGAALMGKGLGEAYLRLHAPMRATSWLTWTLRITSFQSRGTYGRPKTLPMLCCKKCV